MQLYDKYGSPIITNSYVTKSQRWAHCNRNPLCVVKSTITDFRWQIQQQQKCSWNILRGPSPVKNGPQMPKHCLKHENENKHWIRHLSIFDQNNRRSFGPAKPCSVWQNLNGRRTKCPVNLLSFGEDCKQQAVHSSHNTCTHTAHPTTHNNLHTDKLHTHTQMLKHMHRMQQNIHLQVINRHTRRNKYNCQIDWFLHKYIVVASVIDNLCWRLIFILTHYMLMIHNVVLGNFKILFLRCFLKYMSWTPFESSHWDGSGEWSQHKLCFQW